MNMNEMFIQLATNPQFASQVLQMMQQNGMIPSNNQMDPRSQMNWNMPTNPMAALYNYMNSMNNQNNNVQPVQNQSQPVAPSAQQDNSRAPSVRIVKSPDEIRPDEIPTNGDIGLFVQEDLNVIYGKRWTNNGVVDNLRFVLEKDDQNESGNLNNVSKLSVDMDAFFEKISKMIDEKLSRFNPSDKNTSFKSGGNKKGVEDNNG